LVKATFQEVMAKPVSPAMFSELYDEFSQPESWHVYKDVVPTLAQLSKRGLKLGIISNWDRRLGILLRRLGLWDFFDVKVVSCHAGEPKPSKGIFRKAANRLGLAPESILHVGDSFEADVAGALQAGFQSVLLRRDNAGARRGAIHSLDELERVLRRLGTREFD
jgi:putative hydrolase of the HAD superfamily